MVGCSSDENIPNLAVTWKMIANVGYQFDLVLTQDGGTITGKLIRTNGCEPEDTVTGSTTTTTALWQAKSG